VGIELFFTVDNEIVGNRILDNGEGVHSYRGGGLFQSNLVMQNEGNGAYLDSGQVFAFENTFSRNGGDGLQIFEEACGFLNSHRVGSNVADGNERLGINVVAQPCPAPFDLLDAGGNSAKHNGDPRECTIEVDCARNQGQAH
jgi:hypothetical protein